MWSLIKEFYATPLGFEVKIFLPQGLGTDHIASEFYLQKTDVLAASCVLCWVQKPKSSHSETNFNLQLVSLSYYILFCQMFRLGVDQVYL